MAKATLPFSTFPFKSKKVLFRGKYVHEEERIIARINIQDANTCWEWKASRLPSGYGRCRFRGRYDYAHRVAFEINAGRQPRGQVLHSCDNPPCCNPAHLREGTPAENMADRDKRGRSGWKRYGHQMAERVMQGKDRKGDAGFARKLTSLQVIELRERRKNGESFKSLCSAFGIPYWSVSRIVRGVTYKKLFARTCHFCHEVRPYADWPDGSIAYNGLFACADCLDSGDADKFKEILPTHNVER